MTVLVSVQAWALLSVRAMAETLAPESVLELVLATALVTELVSAGELAHSLGQESAAELAMMKEVESE